MRATNEIAVPSDSHHDGPESAEGTRVTRGGRARRVAALAVFVSLAAVGVLDFAQRALLYHPVEAPPEALSREGARRGLQVWPEGATAATARGLVAAPREGPTRGTIALLHGNAGSSWDREGYVAPLVSRGFRLILLEYPGYGGRAGVPSQRALVDDAASSLRMAHAAYGAPLYVLGESLGAGVAAGALALCNEQVSAAVLVTPWDELATPARALLPRVPSWALRTLLRDRYDSVAALARFHHPLGVVIAERDEVIPPSAGHALYERFDGPKRRWVIHRAGHNTWTNFVDASFWSELASFITRETAATP